MYRAIAVFVVALLLWQAGSLPYALAADPSGNRLAYLNGPLDPYYPHRNFARLTTPQWVGEEGVDCVVTLGIDDMRDPAKYEAYLRPILDRLKKIEGRAPVSIMTCTVSPADPQLQAWLKEGLSIECHTIDHPCPCLQKGDFAAAKSTYDRCVDLMFKIPGNLPVAFRMPCCDSMNTPSPRFWQHAFNATTPNRNYLQIDSSVFNVITGQDEELPREIRFNEKGEERFRRYIPFPNFANTIDDYPYPYVIGNLCWEFPCVVPSDWSAQHVQKPNNPDTVRDWKLALDAVVTKKGVFNLVFHPHNWIRPEQVIELIDHAQEKYGRRVKFLTFRQCAERLEKNLLQGQPLRTLAGNDNGVRVLDVDNDGLMDVVVANNKAPATYVWNKEKGTFEESFFPRYLRNDQAEPRMFGVFGTSKQTTFVGAGGTEGWTWDGKRWQGPRATGLVPAKNTFLAFSDFDGDGIGEVLAAVINGTIKYWREPVARVEMPINVGLPFGWMQDTEGSASSVTGRKGFRLIDVNGDGKLDLLQSDTYGCALYLFESIEKGWSIKVFDHSRTNPVEGMPVLPPFVRADGTNNGVWQHGGKLWWQNEHTATLPDKVERFDPATFKPLLAKAIADHAGVEAQLEKQREIDKKRSPESERRVAAHKKRIELKDQPPILVGAAKVDITPDYKIRLAGYAARKTEHDGVEQHIFARAVAFGGGPNEDPAVIVSVENCGVPEAMLEAALKKINETTKLPRERFVVSSTHTHSAPWINGFAPLIFPYDIPEEEKKHVDQYTEELTNKIAEAALAAIKAREPARLSRAETTIDFAANRRAQGGPVDHRVSILSAESVEKRRIIAVLFNYACHNTCHGGDWNKIDGDWSGYAMERLETYLKRRDTQGIALSLIGCGADANPTPRGTLELTKEYGHDMAREIYSTRGEEEALPHQLTCQLTHVDLPWQTPPTTEEFEKRSAEPGIVGHHAKYYLKKLAAGEKIDTPLKYPVATWTFGDDLAMVFLAGEVVVDYSIALHERCQPEKLWVTAYANDVPCYIPSQRILKEGGYEAESSLLYYGRPARLSPDVEDIILDTVQKLLPHTFYSAERQLEFPPPKSPQEAIKTMQLPPGFKIELVASEPLIVDPVAFDWGADGSLWVVEMRDYPLGIDGQGKPGGRVKHLFDDNADGRFDRAELFLDDIPFPTGVKVWRKGVLISAAPEIFYAEDTNADGKADQRETLYRGFGEGNQQHRVNGLRWGLDGWLYVGNGDSGGEIESLKTKKRVAIGGRDLRIRPDTGEMEAQSGNTQFGRECDDWGNWFGGNNSQPMWHYTLDDHYLRRNQHVAAGDTRKQVSVNPGNAQIFPASKTLMRFNDFHTANRFTSACSPIIYRDTLLGEEFYGNSFVCEPVHNLVHREIVSPEMNRATFTSRRSENEQASEFLASTDNWFRPSMVRTGPDGALYISDMYRFVIEHPTWIPQAIQRKLDLRAGEDKGRIYRVYRETTKPRKIENLNGFDTGELVAMLQSPNGWQRDMAQQLLVWDKHEAAAEPLRKLLKEAKQPTARVHAHCTLELLGKLTEDDVLAACQDEHAAVRRHAVRCAEAFIKSPKVLDAVANRSGDVDRFVLVQVAYTLGASSEKQALSALALTLSNHRDDPILTAAALSSARADTLGEQLAWLFATGPKEPPPATEKLLAMASALGNVKIIDQAIAKVAPADQPLEVWRMQALARMLEALDAKDAKLVSTLSPESFKRLDEIEQRLPKLAAESTLEERLAATRLIPLVTDAHDAVGHLRPLFDPKQPPEIQVAAAAALAREGTAEAIEVLLEGWTGKTPSVRGQVLDLLLSSDAGAKALLAALEKGSLPTQDLDTRRRQQLTTHRSAEVRELAGKILVDTIDANRQKVIEEYTAELTRIAGDVARGKEAFAKKCSQCHKLDGVGHEIGANLAALTDRSPQAMLIAVLDPNRAVETKFIDYLAVTEDGRQHRGILASETSTSLTLVGPEGKQQTILRSELEDLKSTGLSMMPVGLEKELPPQMLADLLAYFGGFRPPSKSFPGNKPELIETRDDGSIRMPAAAARIYGPSIVFEQQYGNLGYWSSPEDRAAWDFAVREAGEYQVSLDFACAADAAGNTLVLSVAGQKISFKVPSTGTWDQYKGQDVGSVKLPQGPVELSVASEGTIKVALIDLRSVKLSPVK